MFEKKNEFKTVSLKLQNGYDKHLLWLSRSRVLITIGEKNKNEIEFRGLQYIIYKYARLFWKIECLYKT